MNYILSNSKQDYLASIKHINEHFLSLITPRNLDGDSKNNVIVVFSVNFEQLCIALMSNGAPDPKRMTVLRFYAALKHFDERKTKNNEGNRNR